MSKIDASELIKCLEDSLSQAEECLFIQTNKLVDCQAEVARYKHLLSLVKYEEEKVVESKSSISYVKINTDGSIDWSTVPVDTLVEVRDTSAYSWKVRHFASYDESNNLYKYRTYCEGYNSLNTMVDDYTNWVQCRLYAGGVK